MKHCLLFGASGHLARTKVIPALLDRRIPYTAISRRRHENLTEHDHKNLFAFMSIPSKSIIECVKPYESFFNKHKPLFVLEKPHGIDRPNFDDIQAYFNNQGYDVVFNDHYIGKSSLTELIHTDLPTIKNISSIDITLHENVCVNDRLAYFDSVGILLDMYQSHVLVVLSTILAHCKYTEYAEFPTKQQLYLNERSNIIKTFSKIVPHDVTFDTYDTYKGVSKTSCKIQMKYKDIDINVSCGKMLPDQKEAIIHTYFGKTYTIDLSNSVRNPYSYIFELLQNENLTHFLSEEDVYALWEHVSGIQSFG